MSRALRRSMRSLASLLLVAPVLALVVCGCAVISLVDGAVAATTSVVKAPRE